MLTRMSPASAVPNWASTHSLLLGDQDADAIPLFEAERPQAHGQVLRPPEEIGVAPADGLVARNERGAAHGLAEAIHLEEGSGISRNNRFTAHGLAKVLESLRAPCRPAPRP